MEQLSCVSIISKSGENSSHPPPTCTSIIYLFIYFVVGVLVVVKGVGVTFQSSVFLGY